MFEFEKQLIKAGAGTGKTRELIYKVYQLFNNQKNRNIESKVPRIIVCTFTRKACQELQERLFGLCHVENKQNTFDKDFLQYVRSSSLYISTIDGILNLFLKRYGYRFGFSPDFQICQDDMNEQLFDSMAQEFLFNKNISLLKEWSYSDLKHFLIFYFKCRLQYGSVSFYDKNDFQEFQKQKQILLLHKGIKNLKTSSLFEKENYLDREKKLMFDIFNTDEEVCDFLKVCKDEKDTKADFFIPFFQKLEKTGEEFFSEFLNKKRNESELSISDLSLFSLALLRESPQTAKDFSSEWDYWLIDEYQDTSWIQEQIIQKITQFKNVFCVGDPGQSIYRFRNADPSVFQRAEKRMKNHIKKLNINYRSIAPLISFYNDFFSGNDMFLKIKPCSDQVQTEKPCVNFFTYEKNDDKTALEALFYYVQDLKLKDGQIAILSSRNKDLERIANYLRSKGLNPTLYSSKSFSKKRLILDSLFLLKFIINPHDNDNLKALFRTPYFYFPDQKLAEWIHKYMMAQKEEQIRISFWSFVEQQLPHDMCIKSLCHILKLKNQKGIVTSFETALRDYGFMALSYYQDPTGSSESALWKLLYLLNQKQSKSLDLFYDLMLEEQDKEDHKSEPPSCDEASHIELMSIHKSKGLQFQHVVIMDFSIGQSRIGRKTDFFIYDERKKKIACKVPEEHRDGSKIKSFGHAIYDFRKKKESMEEKDRLFYVAMTRAQQSLTMFLPNSIKPERNSWLIRQNFFKKFLISKNPSLEKNSNKTLWYFREKDYKNSSYFLKIQSSQSLCASHKVSKINSQNKNLNNSEPLSESVHFKIKGKKVQNNQGHSLITKSSTDFVADTIKDETLKEDVFILQKVRNTISARNLGVHLHSFLQQLSYRPLEQVQLLVENSLLSLQEKNQIKQALDYVIQIKAPPLFQLLKNGFSEWPFKLQKQNLVFQGQVDFWAKTSNDIYLCDYKSSLSQTLKAKQQLIFYSGVFHEIYPNCKIWMYQIYPFQKKIVFDSYEKSHKNIWKNWLNETQQS